MKLKSLDRLEFKFIALWSVLFVLSLFLPAITYKDYEGINSMSGFEMFFMGLFAILGGGLFEWIIWLANPLSILSVILFFQKQRAALITSKIALFLVLIFITWRNLLVSENGRTAEIMHKNSGYWVWLVSIFFLAIGIQKLMVINATSSTELGNSSLSDLFNLDEIKAINSLPLELKRKHMFKMKFQDKTTSELNEIVRGSHFEPVAKAVAKEILIERKNTVKD